LGLIILNLNLDSLVLSLLFSTNFEILGVPAISLQTLDKGKLYVYHPDKNTIAFVFNNYLQAARELVLLYSGKRSFSTNRIQPVKVYENPDIQKKQIYLENKGKPGVYR